MNVNKVLLGVSISGAFVVGAVVGSALSTQPAKADGHGSCVQHLIDDLGGGDAEAAYWSVYPEDSVTYLKCLIDGKAGLNLFPE